MRKRNALICHLLLLACVAGLSESAFAHIGTADDYECMDSYKKDCLLMTNSRKLMRMTFEGQPHEMGFGCVLQTQKLKAQIRAATELLGVAETAISLSAPFVESHAKTGQPTTMLCRYAIRSEQADLRFSVQRFDRHFWVTDDDIRNRCAADARAAEAIPGAIGAALSLSGAILQGRICNTYYLSPGLDRFTTDSSGETKIEKYDGPVR